MTKHMKKFKAFCSDEDASAAIEYALLAGLIMVAIIVAVTALGEETSSSFEDFSTELEAAKS